MKKILFQLHWLLGISAGLVLALMGVTGAGLSYQDELLRLLNPGVMSVGVPAGASALGPDALVARLGEQAPGRQVLGLSLYSAPQASVRVNLSGGGPRGETVYVDPYTGELLGAARGQGFFQFVMKLHRWLAIGDTGKAITGAATLALVFLCLSGLYLRWPRKATSWRAWLILDWRQQGRGFLWSLHAVVGTWVLLAYLLAALTGLYWSYDWYRSAVHQLAGEPLAHAGGSGGKREQQASVLAAPVALSIARPWQGFGEAVQGDWRLVRINLPAMPGDPLQVRYVAADAPHDWAFSQLQIAADGKVIAHDRFADKSVAGQLLGSVYPLHSGAYFGAPGRLVLLLASALMPLFFISGWQLYLGRRRSRQAAHRLREELGSGKDGSPWLVLYASQSGSAERLAWQTAGQLQAAGEPIAVRCLSQTSKHNLRCAERVLFVVSTFGDGEAPDSARGFARQVLDGELDLGHLRYALLGLGDRHYQRFCGFARELREWLERQGAQALFAPVEVDGGDVGAIELWRRQVDRLHGGARYAAPAEPVFTPWTLHSHTCLNPNSSAEPVYRLAFRIVGAACWKAGDLVEIQPPVPGEAPRRYSIASLMSEDELVLLVRRHRRADGSDGLCSGWLAGLAPGAQVPLRVCANPAFRLPEDGRPLLLIGNGTGLAGLRALLQQRIAKRQRRNWLIFGERTRAQDFLCGEELHAWHAAGELARLDIAFSRDQAQKVYVQDRLRQAADEVRRWVAQGASIYVCGSLQGMGQGVEAALVEILGEQTLAQMREQGFYRRDLY